MGVRRIALTRGATTLVDEEDYETLVSMGKWHLSDTGYAVRRTNKITIRMHRVLTNAPDGLVTDHINNDPLDNRRANLRVVTQKENSRNQKGHKDGTIKGYWYHGQNNNWVVEVHGIHRGVFDTEPEAKQFAEKVYAGIADRKPKTERTECRRGHSLDDAYVYGNQKLCRTCQSIRSKKWFKKTQLAKKARIAS